MDRRPDKKLCKYLAYLHALVVILWQQFVFTHKEKPMDEQMKGWLDKDIVGSPGAMFRGLASTAASLCFLKALRCGCYKPPAALKRRVSGQV